MSQPKGLLQFQARETLETFHRRVDCFYNLLVPLPRSFLDTRPPIAQSRLCLPVFLCYCREMSSLDGCDVRGKVGARLWEEMSRGSQEQYGWEGEARRKSARTRDDGSRQRGDANVEDSRC